LIVLQSLIGTLVYFSGSENITRNEHSDNVSHQNECSSNQFSSEIRMDELHQCRTRICQLERAIGFVGLEMSSIKHQIDETLGGKRSMVACMLLFFHHFLIYISI
ncbi:hypothetical protein SETIT_1G284900v2, partial [Setaria italica]